MRKETRIYNGEMTVSSINGVGKTGIFTCKRMKLDHFLIPWDSHMQKNEAGSLSYTHIQKLTKKELKT